MRLHNRAQRKSLDWLGGAIEAAAKVRGGHLGGETL